MRFLRRIIKDLTGGRHLDLYLTAFMSVALGVLGAFDVVDLTVLVAATLATLGLVVIGSLGDRAQLAVLVASADELTGLARSQRSAATEQPSADRLLSASVSGLDVDLRGARDIRIVGVTLARTIRNHLPALAHGLREGAVVRVALIEPDHHTLAEAARRSAFPDSPEIFHNRLQPTIDLLDQLAATPGRTGRLEVRFLAFVPAFGLLAVDPDDLNGRVHVDIYSHRTAEREPTLALRADRDPRWYRHFLREFDQVWSSGHVRPRHSGHNTGPKMISADRSG